jgi:anti-sigma-K factor RskA
MRRTHHADVHTDPAQDENLDQGPDLGLDLIEELAEHDGGHRSRPARKWLLVVVAAAVLLIGGISLALSLAPRDLAAEVAKASDRVETTVEIEGGGTAAVAVSDDADAGTVTLSGLPGPQAGSDYQLWVLAADSGSPSSLQVVSRDALDTTAAFKGLDAIEGLSLTVEPQGGSAGPTSDAVVTVELPETR